MKGKVIDLFHAHKEIQRSLLSKLYKMYYLVKEVNFYEEVWIQIA